MNKCPNCKDLTHKIIEEIKYRDLIFDVLKALVECPDYRKINTLEMNNAIKIINGRSDLVKIP